MRRFFIVPLRCVVHLACLISSVYSFFFFNDTATTEIYTLSLHDDLPISRERAEFVPRPAVEFVDLADDREVRSEEHTSELQSHSDLVCRLLLEKKKIMIIQCAGPQTFSAGA